MAHHAIRNDSVPEPGSIHVSYMPNANVAVGDTVTVITTIGSGRVLRYGEVVEKDLSGYVSPVQVNDHTEPRDLGKGYVRIQIDEK